MLVVMQLAIRVSLVGSQDHALVSSRAISLVTMMEQLASSAMRAPAMILVTTEPLMEDPLKALRTRALISIRVHISEKIQAKSGM